MQRTSETYLKSRRFTWPSQKAYKVFLWCVSC